MALSVKLNVFEAVSYTHLDVYKRQGINRLIDKIQTLTIPARNKASVYVSEDGSWAAASGKTIPLSVFRSRPAGFPFVPDSMKDGFQMSTLMTVSYTHLNRWNREHTKKNSIR